MEDTTVNTSSQLPVDMFGWTGDFLAVLFGADGMIGSLSLASTAEFLAAAWGVFVVISYLLSFIFLILYVYASIHYNELEEEMLDKMHADEDEFARKRQGGATANRFSDMKSHIESENPNDWKLAIIEADIILDESLKRLGYAGTSLGERLRSVSSEALHSIDDAWQAHKVRNEIAHGGADFVLTNKLARETIVQYERVFEEMGLLSGNTGGGHH